MDRPRSGLRGTSRGLFYLVPHSAIKFPSYKPAPCGWRCTLFFLVYNSSMTNQLTTVYPVAIPINPFKCNQCKYFYRKQHEHKNKSWGKCELGRSSYDAPANKPACGAFTKNG